MLRAVMMASLTWQFLLPYVHTARGQEIAPVPTTIVPSIGRRTSFECEAIVRIEPLVVAQNTAATVTCEIRVIKGSANIYNGFLSENYRVPMRLLVRSVDGKVRREIQLGSDERVESPDAQTWVALGESQSIGRRLQVHVTSTNTASPWQRPGSPDLDLPPGEYFIQTIYSRWVVAIWLNDDRYSGSRSNVESDNRPRPWSGLSLRDMNESFAVSQPVKFVVVEEPSQAAKQVSNDDSPISVSLTSKDTSAKMGREVQCEITIHNNSARFLDVYNPFLNPFLMARQRAVELAISASDGTNLGDLLTFTGGSTLAGPRRRDWIRMPPRGITRTVVRFCAGSVPGTPFFLARELPPGKYSLELRAGEPLVSGPPSAIIHGDPVEARQHPSYDAWCRSFPGREICRSNRVELEILPRTGD